MYPVDLMKVRSSEPMQSDEHISDATRRHACKSSILPRAGSTPASPMLSLPYIVSRASGRCGEASAVS
jgi:hypothetical protein